MNRLTPLLGLALASLLARPTMAADHIDSPAAVADPAADITDLYSWMSSDASKLNLVMNVTPFAGSDAAFSDATQYVFHINSMQGYGMEQTETLLLCQFDASSEIECWIGDEYLKGDASAESGLSSQSGKVKVFAGLRNDPFFMELTGFQLVVQAVIDAASSLTFDNGCPELNEATASALVGQLASGMDGADASDTLAGADVLSLVVEVDKSLVTSGGPVLGVWASTHSRN